MAVDAHFKNIRSVLQHELSQATRNIRVAVAWFTDAVLYQLLLDKLAAEISVIVVVRNDVVNLSGKGVDWQAFIEAGGTLYFSHERPALHHKFCLVDSTRVVSGSYNWTYAAQYNHENVVVSDQAEVAKSFLTAFTELLTHAEEVASIAHTALRTPPKANTALEYEAFLEVECKNKTEAHMGKQQDYETCLRAGEAAYLQKWHDEAEGHLQQALTVNKKGLKAYELLAKLYWRTNQFYKALDTVNTAEACGLASPSLCNTSGLAHHGLGNFKVAISSFDKTINFMPQDAGPYRNKHLAQKENKQTKDAEDTALLGGVLAAAAIRQYEPGGYEALPFLLRAYIDRSMLHSNTLESRLYAQKALAVFKRLPVEQQDLHYLDDIKLNLGDSDHF